MEIRFSHGAVRARQMQMIRLLCTTCVFWSMSAIANGQIQMSIPTTLSGSPGSTIVIPVNLTVVGNQLSSGFGNGIGADQFVIGYNPTISSNVGTITLGSLISNPSFGFSSYTTNNTPGFIRAVTSSNPGTLALPPGTTGSIAFIPFTIDINAAPGSYPLDILDNSNGISTSIVDNNFTTYTQGPVLIFFGGTLTVTPVPEPSTLFCVGIAVSAFAAVVRRRRKNGLVEK